ncbi:insulinase family protein [Vaginisenegalia massiliensis]|uniref:insulinase family protein n=1 Tax=Vaginisenegalia massiliensis TaxID=2058294 RepID=UPI000F539CDD|nr:insulinase family protein [Vaginisenegalia massiliensis]
MATIFPNVCLNHRFEPESRISQISLHFLAPYSVEQALVRTFLARLIESSSQVYPERWNLRRAFYQKGGSNLTITCQRWGNLHDWVVESNLVHLNKEDSLNDDEDSWLQLIGQTLSQQDFSVSGFQANFLTYEVQQLALYFEQLQDDPIDWAFYRAFQTFYEQENQEAYGSYGNPKYLNQIGMEKIYQAYQDLMLQNKIVINYRGPKTYNELAAWAIDLFSTHSRCKDIPDLRQLGLPNRIYASQVCENGFQEQTIQIHFFTGQMGTSLQANLVWQIIDQILVQLPTSIIFQRIREELGLVYELDSQQDMQRQLWLIHYACQEKQRQTCQREIAQLLNQLGHNQRLSSLFESAKLALMNALLIQADDPIEQLDTLFYQQLSYGTDYTVEQIIEDITKIELKQVEDILTSLTCIHTYTYRGTD